MTSQTDQARENARDTKTGQFGEQHLQDPGTAVLDAADPQVCALADQLRSVDPATIAAAIAQLGNDEAVKVGVQLEQQVSGLFWQLTVANGVHGNWWTRAETVEYVEDWAEGVVELTDEEVRNTIDDTIGAVVRERFGDRMQAK